MANEGNIIPYQFKKGQSSEEAAKNGRKGGFASGKSRRETKKLKEYANILLSLPITDGQVKDEMIALGIDTKDMNNKMLLFTSLFMKAAAKGDVAAFKEIRNILGEDDDTSGLEELNKLDEMIELTKRVAEQAKNNE